jgi:quinol monooxygenase YgiN
VIPIKLSQKSSLPEIQSRKQFVYLTERNARRHFKTNHSSSLERRNLSMPSLLVRHKVQDYGKWKPVFDAHATARKSGGCKGGRLFRNANDPNEIVMLFEWDSVENAQKFAQSPDLREAMQRAGVVDKPDVYFLEEVEKVPV